MVYQVIFFDLWQLESEALIRENKYLILPSFFAICQIIPLENESYVLNFRFF